MDTLDNDEIENCRIAFNKFDKDGSGTIADWELKAMLQCTRRSAAAKMRPAGCS
jgi:Ca2+-binding EF-hand superfamily protein